jgi:hypothetical protein
VVSTKTQDGCGRFSLIGHHHCEFLAARLRGAREPYSGLTVTARRPEDHVKIFVRVGVVDQFLEVGDRVRIDHIHQRNEPALEPRFVLADQPLTLVASRILCIEEWSLTGKVEFAPDMGLAQRIPGTCRTENAVFFPARRLCASSLA